MPVNPTSATSMMNLHVLSHNLRHFESSRGCRTQSIAINSTVEPLTHELLEESDPSFSAKRHYNAATWRMYIRITEHRRKQHSVNDKETDSCAVLSCGDNVASQEEDVSAGKSNTQVGSRTQVHFDDSFEEIFSMDL